jgi:hypothetical protein
VIGIHALGHPTIGDQAWEAPGSGGRSVAAHLRASSNLERPTAAIRTITAPRPRVPRPACTSATFRSSRVEIPECAARPRRRSARANGAGDAEDEPEGDLPALEIAQIADRQAIGCPAVNGRINRIGPDRRDVDHRAVGAILIGEALYQGYNGVSQTFLDDSKTRG